MINDIKDAYNNNRCTLRLNFITATWASKIGCSSLTSSNTIKIREIRKITPPDNKTWGSVNSCHVSWSSILYRGTKWLIWKYFFYGNAMTNLKLTQVSSIVCLTSLKTETQYTTPKKKNDLLKTLLVKVIIGVIVLGMQAD